MRMVMLCLCVFACLLAKPAMAQDSTSLYNKLYNLPDKFFSGIHKKSQKLGDQLTRQTEKYLAKLQRQEKQLRKKLAKKDSVAAKELFGDVDEKYAALKSKLKNPGVLTGKFRNVYSGHMDSMKTALHFLEQNQLIGNKQEQLQSVMNQYGQLQGKLNQTDEIKKILQQRQQYLKGQMEKFGLTKQFRKFQKDVYYYRAQIDEYKSMLEDPLKLESKLLEAARKIPAFKNFFAKNSELGQLFRLPGSDPMSNAASIAGLQTRAMIQQDLQNRFGSGANITQAIQQNIQSAQSELDNIKNKLLNSSPTRGGREGADIPNFKPNTQKTKSFWQRIELGTNVQTTRSNNFFPVTSDLGLSVGYKLNDQSIIGIGGSYKMGWGQNIRNIRITHQGLGLRSFLDWKLKGSFYASGGFEYNYQEPFNSFQQVYHFNDWRQSGLIGVSKIISVKSKLFKKTKLQLLWDFLSYRQRPAGQPVKFRVGYMWQ